MPRVLETDFLTSEELKVYLKENNIHLYTYDEEKNMAHLTCNFFSKSLMRNALDITVILPTDKYVFTDPDFSSATTLKRCICFMEFLAVHPTGSMVQELKLGRKKEFGGRDV